MLFTKASEYALMAMIALADSPRAQDAESLAAELGISRSFLAKILQNLARSGLVNSYKGIRGGFELAAPPAEISIAQIARAAERRNLRVFECSSGVCPSERAGCLIAPVMQRLQRQIDGYLEAISLAALIAGEGGCGDCDGESCAEGCDGGDGGGDCGGGGDGGDGFKILSIAAAKTQATGEVAADHRGGGNGAQRSSAKPNRGYSGATDCRAPYSADHRAPYSADGRAGHPADHPKDAR